jgi:hypothetical protein
VGSARPIRDEVPPEEPARLGGARVARPAPRAEGRAGARPGAPIPSGEPAAVGRVVARDGDAAVVGGAGQGKAASAQSRFRVALVSEATGKLLARETSAGGPRGYLPPGGGARPPPARAPSSRRGGPGPIGATSEAPADAPAGCIGTLHLAFRPARPRVVVEDGWRPRGRRALGLEGGEAGSASPSSRPGSPRAGAGRLAARPPPRPRRAERARPPR